LPRQVNCSESFPLQGARQASQIVLQAHPCIAAFPFIRYNTPMYENDSNKVEKA